LWLTVPPEIFRFVIKVRMSFSETLVLSGISGRSRTRSNSSFAKQSSEQPVEHHVAGWAALEDAIEAGAQDLSLLRAGRQLVFASRKRRARPSQTFAPSGQKTARSASPPASRALRPQRLIADRQAPREHERFKPAHVLDHNRLAGHPALETSVFRIRRTIRSRSPSGNCQSRTKIVQ
jgi:hypothetical protein